MIRPLTLITGGLLWLAATSAQATPGEASFETCGNIAGEQLTTIQLYQRGLSLEVLKETLPGLSSEGEKRVERFYQAIEEEGLTSAYSATNARYARCAKSVNDRRGIPERGTREHHFYVCAGENKVRYEVLLAAWAGGDIKEVLPQLQPAHREPARAIYEQMETEGTAQTFNALATELKRCLNGAP